MKSDMTNGILAIDPASAKLQGCAWTDDGKRYHVESVALVDIRGLLIRLKNHVDLCVIEDGFVGVNKRVALALAVARGEIKGHAESLGYTVYMLAPMTWQTACLSHNDDKKPINMVPKKQRMKRTMLYVRSLKIELPILRTVGTVRVPVTEDEMCAACMCAWAWKQRVLGMMGAQNTEEIVAKKSGRRISLRKAWDQAGTVFEEAEVRRQKSREIDGCPLPDAPGGYEQEIVS